MIPYMSIHSSNSGKSTSFPNMNLLRGPNPCLKFSRLRKPGPDAVAMGPTVESNMAAVEFANEPPLTD